MRAEVFTPRHLKAARAWLGWSSRAFAVKANIGASTVADFERGFRKPKVVTLRAMRRTIEAEGIVLTESGFYQVKQ